MKCPSCGNENPAEARFCANCGAAMAATSPTEVQPTQAPAPGQPKAPPRQPATDYAGFWIRFGAWAIDTFLFLVMVVGLGILYGLALLARASGGGGAFALVPVVSVLAWLVPIAFFWIFTGLKGQTPGKMLVGIKVVDAQGNVPGLGRAALREIVGKLISSLAFSIGFLWVAWDEKKQAWHDRMAGTYVIRFRR